MKEKYRVRSNFRQNFVVAMEKDSLQVTLDYGRQFNLLY